MKRAFSGRLYELPYTETMVDTAAREVKQERVFKAGNQHWGKFC